MYYIKETDKPNKFNEIFHIVKLENDTIVLPTIKTSKKEKTIYKLAVKTKKILDKTNSKKLVLSKNIKQQEEYVNDLYSYGYEIVDGKWLFQLLIFDVLEYIIKKLELKKEHIGIAILVNDISELAIYVIKELVTTYKNVKIVTNHIHQLEHIEEKIIEEYGIFMNIGNNKRKILSKTDIILNLDFPTEVINKYQINSKATIINFRGNVKIKNKRFEGLNINDYEIHWKKSENTIFYTKDMYEAIQHKNQPIEDILKKIRQDQIQIKELIAVNTII